MSKKPYVGLSFARRPGEKWPRLSLELTEIRHPEYCQSCGMHEGDLPASVLSRWRERDDRDVAGGVIVILCGPCEKTLIEPHPRLYDKLDEHAPWPGCMPLCVDCRHRCGLECMHPDAKANGGSEVALTMPKPFTAFWCGRSGPKGGRRTGGVMTTYPGPVSGCAGRETMAREIASGSGE